ncbi:class I SAM-dependent methyltransferase [Candidatus Latescibacterota bacterium]
MKKTVIVLMFASLMFTSLFMLPGELFCQDNFFDYDVPYVPTPVEIVEEMLEMAQVGKNDILYDLGCGDGRIVVMAAKKYGTIGVGFDIDPQRIADSRKNAFSSNVIGNVRFYEQDFFLADISDATVLTLYLLTSINLKLRPKIFDELKPGTRVVSHNYGMGDWKPDKSKDIGSHSVNFWVVPANVSGTWEWGMENAEGDKKYVVMLDQLFQHVRGYVNLESSKLPLKNVKLTGEALRFEFEETENGSKVAMLFEGSIRGDTIEGSVTTVSGTDSYKTSWNTKRDPSTMLPLDE